MKKPSVRNLSFLGIVLVAVLTGSMAIMFSGSGGGLSRFIVYGAGTSDSYGNRIYQFDIMQNASGTWTTITGVGYASYTPGFGLSVPANQHTIIKIMVRFNMTLAADLTTAAARTRIYLNVSGVVSNFLMIYGGGTGAYPPIGDGFWYLYYYYPSASFATTWVPATDTTYTTTAQYQAYY